MESRGLNSDLSDHITAGAGITLSIIRFDYAYNQVDYTADPSQHKVSVSFFY